VTAWGVTLSDIGTSSALLLIAPVGASMLFKRKCVQIYYN